MNLNIYENLDTYIIYYNDDPVGKFMKTKSYLKWLLAQVRNDDIYNGYNDDYGLHDIVKSDTLVKVKVKVKVKVNAKA